MSDTLANETITTPSPKPGSPFQPAYRFIEFFSASSHVGKSMLAMFAAQLLTALGVKVRLVRIESKAAARSRDPKVVHIDSEDFAAAARLPGAEVAILRPVFELIEKAAKSDESVILIDWGGGLATHRAKIYAATRFDARLSELKMR